MEDVSNRGFFNRVTHSRNMLIDAISHQQWDKAVQYADDFKTLIMQKFFEENVETEELGSKFISFIRLLHNPCDRVGPYNKSRILMQELEGIRNYISGCGIYIGQRQEGFESDNVVKELNNGLRNLIYLTEEAMVEKVNNNIYIINQIETLMNDIIPRLPSPNEGLRMKTIQSCSDFLSNITTTSLNTTTIAKDFKDALAEVIFNINLMAKVIGSARTWKFIKENPTIFDRSQGQIMKMVKTLIKKELDERKKGGPAEEGEEKKGEDDKDA